MFVCVLGQERGEHRHVGNDPCHIIPPVSFGKPSLSLVGHRCCSCTAASASSWRHLENVRSNWKDCETDTAKQVSGSGTRAVRDRGSFFLGCQFTYVLVLPKKVSFIFCSFF